MRRLATLAVVAALMSPAVASGQDYTFGDWARDRGYSPGDVMPDIVWANEAGIDDLIGIGEFDWTTTPTTRLYLIDNQLSSIESSDFIGLSNLTKLELGYNQLTSIESGDFSGLTNLERLYLLSNHLSSIEPGAFSGLANLTRLRLRSNLALTELDFGEADFSSLTQLDVGGNVNITSVLLKNTVLCQQSLAALVEGSPGVPMGSRYVGIGELDGITELDFSGIDFANITDLSPLYVTDDLTDLWLVDTQNVDATDLDELLDNLETIEGTDTEGILYMTQADFDAFNTAGGGLLAAWHAEPGHHVEFLQIGDVNHDTEVNGLDVDPFVRLLVRSQFDVAADCNDDMAVNGLDVRCFIQTLISVGTQPVPEPSTLLLALLSLGVVGGRRKWGGPRSPVN